MIVGRLYALQSIIIDLNVGLILKNSDHKNDDLETKRKKNQILK